MEQKSRIPDYQSANTLSSPYIFQIYDRIKMPESLLPVYP